MTTDQAKNLKLNDLFSNKIGNVTFKVSNITTSRIVFIRTDDVKAQKNVMGWKQFFYWFCI
jgi:hypothetical protein